MISVNLSANSFDREKVCNIDDLSNCFYIVDECTRESSSPITYNCEDVDVSFYVPTSCSVGRDGFECELTTENGGGLCDKNGTIHTCPNLDEMYDYSDDPYEDW